MASVLGINAVFHDPAAALVVGGEVLFAAEEERFNRRKHGKASVPFSTWELPENAAAWVLAEAGLGPEDLDAVAYSYDPALCSAPTRSMLGGTDERASWDPWEDLRIMFATQAGEFVRAILPGLDAPLHHVAHHVAHAASAFRCAPWAGNADGGDECAVLVLDGRGEVTSHLSGVVRDGELTVLAGQRLPHSMGLLYEEVTAHLGLQRSSEESVVTALAGHGDPARFADVFAAAVRVLPDGGFRADRVDLASLVPARCAGEPWEACHADLAAAVQHATEQLVLDLGRWLHETTGMRRLAMAGGVALNSAANARLAAEGPFDEIWVQPAAGDAGTAIGAASQVAWTLGDTSRPMTTAALGRCWSEEQIRAVLDGAGVAYERPGDLGAVTAEVLAADGLVGWFEGRSAFGPRALGHRNLLVDPRRAVNRRRVNAATGRQECDPLASMVLLERSCEIVRGRLPSPFMDAVQQVRPRWRDLVPAAVHVDGSARMQTVDRRAEPLLAQLLDEFAARTGVPVLATAGLDTAGSPTVDSPIDALGCFATAPVDLLVLAPFVVRRRRLT